MAGRRVAEAEPSSAVMLVRTVGSASLDYFADQLADRLGVPAITVPGCSGSFGHPLLGRTAWRYTKSDLAVLRRLRKARPRLFHLTSHHLGRFGPWLPAPYLVTAHDLIRLRDWRERDQRPPFIARPSLRDGLTLHLDALGLRRAAAVISVSHHTRRELISRLGLPPERVRVVYEGVDHERFRPAPARLLEEPYVLFVGSEHPRKNLRTLFRAFQSLLGEASASRLRIVKVGSPGGPEASFRRNTLDEVRAAGIGGRVIFTGRISPEDLHAAYTGAECLVLPSLEEGFGLPVLEAMACGCPVVVPDSGALPEIAGGAGAVYGPAQDHRALAAVLRRLLIDESFRRSLVERGLRRARQFSWERAAAETRAVYPELLGEAKDLAGGPRSRREPAQGRFSRPPLTRR